MLATAGRVALRLVEGLSDILFATYLVRGDCRRMGLSSVSSTPMDASPRMSLRLALHALLAVAAVARRRPKRFGSG